ncbi:hypothetical protein OIE90_33540 (plasmid) [Streptomyces cellulosae]|nr:hypothetical protein OG880_32980 [Streptomyces cellulosae]WTB73738.1 hypothetical protein OIE90_33540 [Streptomyces cellulosae]
MTLALIVALVLGGVGVHIAYRDPKLGAAILVGLAIVGTLYIVWEKDPSVFETGVPPASPSPPVQVSPGSEDQAPSAGSFPPTLPSASSTSAS